MRSAAGSPSRPSPESGAPTARAALAAAVGRLSVAGVDTPRLDAELLLGEVLGVDRAGLVMDAGMALDARSVLRFEELVARREAREPVAYILGGREFRRIWLSVDHRVLIPRPETELLVEVALGLPFGTRVADVGTGSGAVALALADERPDLAVTGIEVSEAAVQVALGNELRLGKGVRFVRADLLDGDGYDAVLANLPYVAGGEQDALAPEIAEYEPELALFGGSDGLSVIRRLLSRLPERVRFVALEIGHGQADAVESLLLDAGLARVEHHRDLAGVERVLVGRR